MDKNYLVAESILVIIVHLLVRPADAHHYIIVEHHRLSSAECIAFLLCGLGPEVVRTKRRLCPFFNLYNFNFRRNVLDLAGEFM